MFFRRKGEKNREVPKNRKPLTVIGEGSPLWVGGELLSHGLPQYHRRGGA
jgi:predicted DNA repair protein MutK